MEHKRIHFETCLFFLVHTMESYVVWTSALLKIYFLFHRRKWGWVNDVRKLIFGCEIHFGCEICGFPVVRSYWLAQKWSAWSIAVEMYGNVRPFLQVVDLIGSPDLSQFTDPWCLLIFLWKHITSQLTGTLRCRRGRRSGRGEVFQQQGCCGDQWKCPLVGGGPWR